MKRITIIIALILFISYGKAQTKWTLDDCITYGLANSYAVKQSILNLEVQRVNINTTGKSILPSINAQVGQNFDLGRATSNENLIIPTSQSSTSFGITAQMPLFQGLKIYHQKKYDELGVQAAVYELEKAKEDIGLNITAYYLQVILAKEILDLAIEQKAISEEQVSRIQLLLDNGKTSEAELYDAKANLAQDVVNITNSKNNYAIAKLLLAQLMNIKDVEVFDIALPVDNVKELLSIPIDMNDIIDNALYERPGVKSIATQIEQSKENIRLSKSSYYPSLNLSASYGTGYYYLFSGANSPFFQQFNTNSREMINLTLNIPIFNRGVISGNVQIARIQLAQNENLYENTKHNYIKEIQQAYFNAIAAKDTYIAAQEAVKATEVAYQYEKVKYYNGNSTRYEFYDARIKHQKALSEEVQSKYDFILRTKILDFYSSEWHKR